MVEGQPAAKVELLEKNVPRQARAIKTYEAILEAAAHLLIEVGVERISTNQIAERAGITVPALYRYFPNKYSVLNALGSRLMDRQNAVLEEWHKQFADDASVDQMLDSLPRVFEATYRVTRETTAGLQILNALRAVGPLQQVRLESNRGVSTLFGQFWAERMGRDYDAAVYLKARFAVELGYTAVELALEDDTVDAQAVLAEAGLAIGLYLRKAAAGSPDS
jgi:AcrR family transcriptional regulator